MKKLICLIFLFCFIGVAFAGESAPVKQKQHKITKKSAGNTVNNNPDYNPRLGDM